MITNLMQCICLMLHKDTKGVKCDSALQIIASYSVISVISVLIPVIYRVEMINAVWFLPFSCTMMVDLKVARFTDVYKTYTILHNTMCTTEKSKVPSPQTVQILENT